MPTAEQEWRSVRAATSVSGAKDWFCALDPKRPTYDCPRCQQLAMQFYAQIPGEPEREDVYRCCACGSTWEL